MSRSTLARYAALIIGCALAITSIEVLADPPARVARLSFTSGNVSFSPAADPDNWVQAHLNRPVYIGDRLWTDDGARAELELGTAVLRAGDLTSVTVLNIDDRLTQLELDQGILNVRVRSLASDESFEIDTPNLAFAIKRAGNYRVEVDPQGNSTVVAIRDGHGEVYGEGASYVVDRGQWYRFYGTALDNDYARIPAVDDFDRWALARDARHDRAVSARYVSRAVIGYDDLDEYGTWNVVPEYGNVWVPRSVPADWAPYRNGHWTWIEPWGWTWVDDAPWGFAPFHYGRWAYANARWMWVPGPANVRPIYAPALVAFVGGNDLTINVSSGAVRGVAWFPLAPGEVYTPPYRVTRNYFTEINVTNTRVTNTFVTNIYNNPTAAQEIHYRYHEMPRAVTAVAVNAFVDSRPVARAALPAAQVAQFVQHAPVVAAPVVAPARNSVLGAANPAPAKPPAAVVQRHIVAKTEPPAAPPAYTPHELNVNAGHVVDANPHRAAAQALRERVRVVAPAQPVMAGSAAQHRGRSAGAGASTSAAATPAGAPAPASSAPPAAAPAAAATTVPSGAPAPRATPAMPNATNGPANPNSQRGPRGSRPDRAPASTVSTPATPAAPGAPAAPAARTAQRPPNSAPSVAPNAPNVAPTAPRARNAAPTAAPSAPNPAPNAPNVAPTGPRTRNAAPAAPTEPNVAPTAPRARNAAPAAPTEANVAPTAPRARNAAPTAAPSAPTVAPTTPPARANGRHGSAAEQQARVQSGASGEEPAAAARPEAPPPARARGAQERRATPAPSAPPIPAASNTPSPSRAMAATHALPPRSAPAPEPAVAATHAPPPRHSAPAPEAAAAAAHPPPPPHSAPAPAAPAAVAPPQAATQRAAAQPPGADHERSPGKDERGNHGKGKPDKPD